MSKASESKPDVRAIRDCLAYLVTETERAKFDFCALHLRLAIEELDCATLNTGSGVND